MNTTSPSQTNPPQTQKLVNLAEHCPELVREHVGEKQVACTPEVWDLIQRAIHHPHWGNDLEGVVHDILWTAKEAIPRVLTQVPDAEETFAVWITGTGRQRRHFLRIRHTVQNERSTLVLLPPTTYPTLPQKSQRKDPPV